MDEMTFELFSRTADYGHVQKCLTVLSEYLNFSGAVFRVSGDSADDDELFGFEGIKSGSWRKAYEKFGRLFFEQRRTYGGVSRKFGFEHLTVVLKDSSLRPSSLNEMFREASASLRADFSFMFGENRASGKYFDISYSANDDGLGLAAGLRDVYWLNFYGTPFVNAIGIENLCELPAFEISDTEHGVFVRITERAEDAHDLKDVLRNQIGNQYFVPKGVHLASTNSSGIVAFLRHLVTIAKLPKDLAVAEVRPKFE